MLDGTLLMQLVQKVPLSEAAFLNQFGMYDDMLSTYMQKPSSQIPVLTTHLLLP